MSMMQSAVPLDTLSPLELLNRLHEPNQTLYEAVAACLPTLAQALPLIAQALRANGRLFYLGAGTSGRLGVLDASECPPTFGVANSLVQGIIAGGSQALTSAAEAAEDNSAAAIEDLKAVDFSARDVLVGITASGSTPYVIAGLQHAKTLGALRIGIACVAKPALAEEVNYCLACDVGAETLLGSTRLKAGSAQKMLLNLLSTSVMVQLGHVYDHWMVSMRASNQKLRLRAVEIVTELTGASAEKAQAMLDETDCDIKSAILLLKTTWQKAQVRQELERAQGNLRIALQNALLEKDEQQS